MDFNAQRILLYVTYYKNTQEKARSSLVSTFKEVSAFSSITDLYKMLANKFAGNISYWLPDKTTYIYLADGCLSIAAEYIECVEIVI